jgi:mono/diheme cytochrome c family protein
MGKTLSGVGMKPFGGYGLAAIVLAAGISAMVLMAPANRSTTFAQTNSGAGEKGEVERGRYLVEEVAKCPECHTPRDDMDQAGRAYFELGRPRATAGRVPEFYRGARGTNSGKGNWPRRRRTAAADAHLSHESRRRESDYRVSQIIAAGRQE